MIYLYRIVTTKGGFRDVQQPQEPSTLFNVGWRVDPCLHHDPDTDTSLE